MDATTTDVDPLRHDVAAQAEYVALLYGEQPHATEDSARGTFRSVLWRGMGDRNFDISCYGPATSLLIQGGSIAGGASLCMRVRPEPAAVSGTIVALRRYVLGIASFGETIAALGQYEARQ